MRNRDLLHIRHSLRLQGKDDINAVFNEEGGIRVGKRSISYIRISAGKGTVGGYQVNEHLSVSILRIVQKTRSFHQAVETLLGISPVPKRVSDAPC